jgi:hypothetical protein
VKLGIERNEMERVKRREEKFVTVLGKGVVAVTWRLRSEVNAGGDERDRRR